MAWLFIASAGRSQDSADSPSDSEQIKKHRAARLEIMRHCASSLEVKVENDGTFVVEQIVDVPLLHYLNLPGETLDATLWAWGRRGRPVALASISKEKSNSHIEKWSCELVSLDDRPVLLTAKPGWKWAPASSGIEWKPVADAPAAGETPIIRVRQMKEIARRFSATGIYQDGKETIELRLIDRPLQRFSDSEHGLIDGAVYAFAGGTNPEVLLMIECRKDGSGAISWHRGFARLGAGRLAARLGETVVWERSEIEQWNPAEPYFSVYGPVETVFESESAAPRKTGRGK
jgi:hypothetical protein